MKQIVKNMLIGLISMTCITAGQNDYKYLKGTVTNEKGVPISGAIVVLANKKVYTKTNEKGIYDFSSGVQNTPIHSSHSSINTGSRHTQFKIINNSISFSLEQDQFVSLDMFNVKGRLIHTMVKKPLTAGAYTIPFSNTIKTHEMKIIRVAIGSHISTFKYLPLGKSTLFSTTLLSKPLSAIAQANQIIDVVRISDPGYLTQVSTIKTYTKPVDAALDTLIPKTGIYTIFDGSMDRFTIFGKTQYFWGKLDGKDVPLVKAIIAAGSKALDIALIFNPNFIDLTYGKNVIGWKKHRFDHLVKSDHVEVAMIDTKDKTAFQAKIDLLSATNLVPSGYACLGVFGKDGSIIKGNAADVVSFGSSFDDNINQFGYHLFEDSPKTDSIYTTNPVYPYWEYYAVYRLTVKNSAFGTNQYKKLQMTYVHASPSKNGGETINVVEKLDPIKIDPFKKVKIFTIPDID